MQSNHPILNRKAARRAFIKHEQDIVKSFVTGRKTPASGATPYVCNKGDGQTVFGVLEAKCTSKRSYTLKYDDLATLAGHAFQLGKIPIMCIRFDFARHHKFENRDFVVMPLEVLVKLEEHLCEQTK